MFDSILGLFREGLPKGSLEVPAEVIALVEKREEARKAKDWAAADECRDAIAKAGYVVEDRPEGPKVKPAG